MYADENVWVEPFELYANITIPGLSPLFPQVQCDWKGEICHITTGEAEINAACSVSALLLSPDFDLTSTYFLIAGIAGVNPFTGTLGSVGLARWAVQVALAYEVDSRQIPSNWTTGYWLEGTEEPGQAPAEIYGSEVFELNTNLRDAIMPYLDGVKLNDTEAAMTYRANYDYAPANQPPQIFFGDVATSDVYFAGSLLGETFGNITKLWTNDTGVYALTAQEDNASLEAMVRASKVGLMDISRVILMRTASDFDRAPHNQETVYSFEYNQGGYEPALANILIAGQPIVEGIIKHWEQKYKKGVKPQDGWLYNSDVLHTLTTRKRKRNFGRFRG
ncbi:hypothetical protein TREMEDRAFT_69953 [Tremella mesenterica DSM 1558]|uniref:uncharacterized protein n=1 Tax=Tremella mesenterica (strain ATCC 24925 / CBS 8224 / DSM 1558 / NBRC 9311 / NRRL Y-6157 / RJB 2259-6 / UBC 559-6) TaxID=578456 RepID=UPI0003F49F29|nr:uncharacterized protein TREMEDRAFT_69953 [Tremella mesenterica DSM 1558]EIW67041.1 hypothetical protein TREMEDRAFT_69953 [Tremella mesenterica DSM 1558]